MAAGRPSWSQFFMDLATATAARSTCPRARVGTVLVKDNRVVSIGYNGSTPGQPHCDDAGCLIVDNHCLRCVHSDSGSLLNAARHGISVNGATAYITHFPCFTCFKNLINAGIVEIHYKEMKLNGMNKAVYEAIVAHKTQIKLVDTIGKSFFDLTPHFENELLTGLV